MQSMRTLIADDELEARQGVATLLRSDPEVVVVAECGDGRDVVAAIQHTAPDLVLLDVEMPHLDGFGVVHAVEPARMPCLVFVTAHDRYALRAFEAHAVDYLLKPFTDARFSAAIATAKARVRERRVSAIGRQLAALCDPSPGVADAPASGAAPVPAPSAAPDPGPGAAEPAAAGGQPGAYLRHFAVRNAGTVSLVRVADVDWIAADDYYARLHVAGKTHLIREPLQRLAAKLDPRQFVRIHRSAIVNLERLRRIRTHPQGGHEVVLHDGTQLLLSRSRRAALEAAIGQSL